MRKGTEIKECKQVLHFILGHLRVSPKRGNVLYWPGMKFPVAAQPVCSVDLSQGHNLVY
jgi:hypothetical protein